MMIVAIAYEDELRTLALDEAKKKKKKKKKKEDGG
jgi:hypothetical protein